MIILLTELNRNRTLDKRIKPQTTFLVTDHGLDLTA